MAKKWFVLFKLSFFKNYDRFSPFRLKIISYNYRTIVHLATLPGSHVVHARGFCVAAQGSFAQLKCSSLGSYNENCYSPTHLQVRIEAIWEQSYQKHVNVLGDLFYTFYHSVGVVCSPFSARRSKLMISS